MIAEIEKYIEIQNNIDQILKDSPFKMSYIIEKSGIKKPTFFKKLKEKRFTPNEVLDIAKVLNPYEQYEFETAKLVEEGKTEMLEGKTSSYSEFLKERRGNGN